MRITSTLPDALDSLLGAIIEAKGVVTLCNWLLSVNLGQFVSTLDAKDDAEQRYFIAKELYAFSSCYGLEHMIVELFPSLDAVLELAQHWFGPNEDPDNPIGQDQYEIFFYWCCEQAFEDAPNYRTLCAIVHTLLEHRPAVHKYFEVHNYGLENIKGRIDKLQVRILSTNNVLGTDELRDKYKDLGSISKDLEALLKLMLLFYQTHFCQDANNDQRFALANECFAEAVEQSKNGLSPTLQAMRSIDSFFENGESNGQRRNRVQRFEEAIIQLTNQYQINRVSYLERENALRKIESDYHNQRESCRIRLAMERELAQDGVTISNLNDQIIELSSSIEAVNQQIKNVEDIRKNEEAQLADKINLTKKNDDKEVKQRKQVAEELRRKCMAVFQRTTPFGTLDTEKIDPIRRHYRNPIMHVPDKLIDEWMAEKGIEPLKKFAAYVRELLDHLEYENLCPMTYISLANMIDSYGRAVSILAPMNTPPKQQAWWPLEKTLWVYDLEQSERFCVAEAYFIVFAGSNVSLLRPARRVLFEPARMACGTLTMKLKQLLPQMAV